MRIAGLKLYHVAVPLKKVVKHASFERSVSENLVVRVELADGQVGYGEGVPRPYVTGETVASTFGVLSAHDWARAIGQPVDFREVVQRLEALRLPETEADPRGMAGNASRCALELAVLDAFGRRFGEPVGRAVELAAVEGVHRFATPQRVRVQRGHHSRVHFRRMADGCEDPDLWLPSGEGEGGHSRTG